MFVYNLKVPNVNAALGRGLSLLTASGHREDSRNGVVAVMPGPVLTIYEKPTQRVLFSAIRDANPFFHVMEALWMLAGRNDLPWLVHFNKQFHAYSDDGGLTQPAAYGHRWINYFGYNQLEAVIQILSDDPTSRRAVLVMYDGGGDRDNSVLVGVGDTMRTLQGSADVPCNTHCYFRVTQQGALDMSVSCRSNDILWGAYGANAVHFSVLLEYIAARLGLKVGVMYQYSFNYHVYLDVIGGGERAHAMAQDAETHDLYNTQRMGTMPMFDDPLIFMRDLGPWMEWATPSDAPFLGTPGGLEDPFLATVASPMRIVWAAHKAKDYARAEALCGQIAADDWRYACRAWIERRALKHRETSNG